MFTGIVEKVAKVESVEAGEKEARVRIATGFADIALGESIAVNGVCLTVADFTPAGSASFYVSPETMRRSNLGALAAGASVNLERSLRVGDRLSGHWVQGHVDGLGHITELAPDRDSYLLELKIPPGLARFCAEKGSIAVNGVSLTINAISTDDKIRIQLVPHTWEHTNFSTLKPGDAVNIEADILAKLLERQCLYAQRSNS